MVSNLKVHFWDIPGYVNLSANIKKAILKRMLSKYSIHNFSKNLKISNVSISHFLNNKNCLIRISNLADIISKLKISKQIIEKNIIEYKDTSSKKSFFIRFPYFLSPLDIRIGGVLIGDGNIHKITGMTRWIQKDVTPLKNLIENLLRNVLLIHTKNSQITIPAFFRKILCHSLSLKIAELNSEKFIEKCLELPKDYCLALLVSIIEDEGNIDSKNFGVIRIRMSSKEKIFAIEKLCNHLCYKTSDVISYKNKGNFGDNLMYNISILSDGIKKLGFDLLKLETNYGKEIGFWKKKNNFTERWKICISKKAEKDRKGRKLHENIRELFGKYKRLSPLRISKFLKIDYNRIYDLMKNMYRRKEIKRIKKGFYTLK